MKKIFTLVVLLISISVMGYSQCTIKGIVVDKNTNEALIGATVTVKGTAKGTITDIDGAFSFDIPKGKQTLEVSYVGYTNLDVPVNATGNVLNLKQITLEASSIGLGEVEVLANVAIDRKTPIAVSTIKPLQIEQKLGTQEFPEILKSTPGIYATKRGGGFGDAEVRIRGFQSNNVAVMVNGMPVNGMENDKVYWSNWSGLSDVTRTMQAMSLS